MKKIDDESQEEKALLRDLEKKDINAIIRFYSNYREDLLIYVYGRLNDRKLAIKTVDEFLDELLRTARFKEIKPPIYKYLVYKMENICEKIMNK